MTPVPGVVVVWRLLARHCPCCEARADAEWWATLCREKKP